MYKIFLLLALLPFARISQSQVTSGFIDSIVNVSMSKFPQAGIGIAVIQNGKITYMKGYGITSVKSGQKVDENTLFAIASNSKAFTSTALGILVDQGKLSWTDKVIDYIPEFRMYDPYVTESFTIVDLLTHRSGLGLGAGDLMFFPDGGDFTIDDVIRSFQYQTPVSDFRTKFDYNNLLYLVAGEVVKRVSGKSWDRFVEDEIMDKLGLTNSAGVFQNITNNTNIAYPHKTENGRIQQIDTYTKSDGSIGAAGGIYSSVKDMSKWVMMHLNEGLYGDNLTDTLISKENHQELWKIHTKVTYSAFGDGIYNNHYRGYGLGFFLFDEKGNTIVHHVGFLPGMRSRVIMIPELKAGIVILTNTDPGGLSPLTLGNEIKDEIIGAEGGDWFEFAANRLNENESIADSVLNAVWIQVGKVKNTKLDFKEYAGRYKDDWFGEVVVYQADNQLWMKSLRSPKLNGRMHYYKANSFVVAWDYRDEECDAFAIFQLDENGEAISISMKGISPNIDFSFDFQDLDLRKITK